MALKLLSPTIEIAIVTTSLPAMQRFYAHTLGLTHEGELNFPGGSMQRYRSGDCVLKLVTYVAPPETGVIAGGGPAACGLRYLSLGVADLNASIDHLHAEGTRIDQSPTAFMDGFGFAFVSDPDGNTIELFGPCR